MYHLNKFGSKLGLWRIKHLLQLLGNPHANFNTVHIAGTNGKGSTASMINSILIESGYKTGLFTSPYLERFTERIRINNNEIPRKEVAGFISRIKYITEEMISAGFEKPTVFEIITAMGFDFFSREKIDIGVIEVGLGGRFDATNVITPLTSVITPISFDHTDILGETLGEIAYEKAGIIKNGGMTVTAPQNKEVNEVIQKICMDRNNKLFMVGKDITYKIKDYSLSSGSVFDLKGLCGEYKNLKIKLAGRHQVVNAAVAVGTVETLMTRGIKIPKDAVVNGLYKARWPGRLEMISGTPRILIDAAHNPAGMDILNSVLKNDLEFENLILILGILKDKNYKAMIEKIVPLADLVIATEPESHRALKAEDLAGEVLKYGINCIVENDIEKAVERALSMSSSQDLLCFTGSIYMIGKVRSLILGRVMH